VLDRRIEVYSHLNNAIVTNLHNKWYVGSYVLFTKIDNKKNCSCYVLFTACFVMSVPDLVKNSLYPKS
jgi:hypothetical protein